MSFCGACGCADTSCEPCTNPTDCTTCNSCCCDEPHRAWRKGRILRGLRVEYLSNTWMGVEVAGAILAGILAGSVALIAFGADSSVELMSGLVVMSHLRSDYKGSEGLGHRTATMTSALLFALIPVVGGLSVYSYLMGVRTEGSLLGIGLAVVAVGLMPLLFYEKRRIGRETGCLSISIDAYATATCLLLSVALLGGLVGVYLTGFGWIDYVATAVILSFIGKEALEAWRESRTGRQPTLDSSGRIFTP